MIITPDVIMTTLISVAIMVKIGRDAWRQDQQDQRARVNRSQ